MAVVYKNGLIVAVVSDGLEEQSSTQEGDLERGDVDVCSVLVPGVCADGIAQDGGKQTIEVEEEEEGQYHAHNDVDEEDPVEAAVTAQRLGRETTAGHSGSPGRLDLVVLLMRRMLSTLMRSGRDVTRRERRALWVWVWVWAWAYMDVDVWL